MLAQVNYIVVILFVEIKVMTRNQRLNSMHDINSKTSTRFFPSCISN